LSLLALLAIFLIVGFFAGILVGMFGIGGGLVFVPTLFYILPFMNIPKQIWLILALVHRCLQDFLLLQIPRYYISD